LQQAQEPHFEFGLPVVLASREAGAADRTGSELEIWWFMANVGDLDFGFWISTLYEL
jgi:hypothetical protein